MLETGGTHAEAGKALTRLQRQVAQQRPAEGHLVDVFIHGHRVVLGVRFDGGIGGRFQEDLIHLNGEAGSVLVASRRDRWI
jgi:hypothetical protein